MTDALRDDTAHAVELFNSGHYFDAHEVLERLWLSAGQEDGLLYQGVLQIAVGLHHKSKGNPRGSLALLRRGLSNMERSPSRAMGLDVAGIRQQVEDMIARIEGGDTLASTGSLSIVIDYRP